MHSTMISATIDQRYLIEDELGRGGMGIVYRAKDQLLERPVAIKIVSAAGLGTEGHSRLLQEAQAAARLNHPNIVAVYDAGETQLPGQDEACSYIVMEYVEGGSLQAQEVESLERAMAIAGDICRALETAHRQGIIHRDLKPENVALTTTDTVKLMDFGLARIQGKKRLTEQGTFMGTMSYLAPEIILGQEATPRSDLYALGVMLYEMAAGRQPFEGDSPTALLSQHLHAPVVPPSAYSPAIPPLLDDLVVRLLKKRPEDRPASAAEVREALSRITTSGASTLTPALPEISRLVRGRMIGREEEFDQAAVMWQRALTGQGQFLFITGEPGIGKTRLVRELITYAEISGGRSLTGYCYAHERIPYGPIAQMVESSLQDGSGAGLPRPVLADLVRLAPELRLAYPDVPPAESLDPEAEHHRMLESIVTWFAAMTRDGPMLLSIEDVHWADSGSLAILRHLIRRADRRTALIVATYREVELDESLPFRQMLLDLKHQRLASRIKLGRLSKEQSRDMLATLFAEEITAEFLDSIYTETEGNPFFIEEVSKALVESGELYFEDGRWHRPDSRRLDVPQGIRVTIQSRLNKLQADDKLLLQRAALLGRDFEYGMLTAVGEVDEDSLIDTLERAERAQLVEEVRHPGLRAGTTFSFTHALIHSTLLSNLSTLRRQRMQRQVALALEEAYPERRRELAPMLGRYFAEAGDGYNAIKYLLAAGDDARAVFSYDEAIDAYEQALIFIRELGYHHKTARALMKLGLTYHNVFEYERSRKAYAEAFVEWQLAGDLSHKRKDLPPAPHALRTVTHIPPATLDPAEAGDGWSFYWLYQLFSGLVELTAEDEIAPDVARSWDVLDGGTRYIFHLREDVTWSDGSPLTAGDFEYGIKRALVRAVETGLAQNLHDIKGAEALHAGRESDPDTVGVRALDDFTLEIALEGPCNYFLQVLSLPTAFAVPQAVIEADGGAWRPPDEMVTSGPFRVRTWRPGEHYLLERNTAYHGRFPGNVEQFELFVADKEEWLERYDRDEVDFVFPFSSVEPGYRAVHLRPDEYVSNPTASSLMMVFNVTKPPFDDVRARQAIAMAIDRHSTIDASLKGIVFPATGGLVPAGIPGHAPGVGPAFDPLAARQKLTEAGYPNGDGFPDVECLLMEDFAGGRAFTVFSEQLLETLGIKIPIQIIDFNTLLERTARDRPHMWFLSWGADYPDPDTFLRAASWLKNGGWRHAEYESMIREARRLTDQGRRMAMYRQAEEILAEEMPIIPLAYARYHVLLKPWVTSWRTSVTKGAILKDVVIEPH